MHGHNVLECLNRTEIVFLGVKKTFAFVKVFPFAGPRAPPRAASIFVRKGPVHGRPKVAPPGLSLRHPLRAARKSATTSQATTRLRVHTSRDSPTQDARQVS